MVLCSSSPSYFIHAASSREKINKPNIEINSARPRFRSSWVLRLKNRSGTLAQARRLSIGQISHLDRIRLIPPRLRAILDQHYVAPPPTGFRPTKHAKRNEKFLGYFVCLVGNLFCHN